MTAGMELTGAKERGGVHMAEIRNIGERLRRQVGEESLFYRAREHALEYMRSIGQRNVYPTVQALEGLEEFRRDLPEDPAAPGEILDMLHRAGSPATVAQTGGRYFGFVNGGILPAALAVKWLIDAWDQNAALYVISPVVSVLEGVCEKWLTELLGLPEGAAAGFVSGTATATLCGLAAGRDELLRRQGWDAGARGLFGAPEIRVVLGAQAHSTVFKALSLLGLGKERITVIPADEHGRIIPGLVPRPDERTLLILQAGNVNTGAFDPFASICDGARKAGSWVHVDGAFGLWAAASSMYRHLTEGVQSADSWSVDAHKTLNAPYDNGIILCRDRDALARSLHMTGSYIAYSDLRDGMRYTPDMSRRARAVELWAVLMALGRKGVAALVEELCGNAQRFADGLKERGFTIRNRVWFNQVLVSCGSPDLTRATLENIQKSGECWCGGATWENEPVIRISVCSFMTTGEDIDRSIRAFVKARDLAGSEKPDR
jgi:glutamate/tyrosine decarboxylase-like PLP-dependent enzyme